MSHTTQLWPGVHEHGRGYRVRRMIAGRRISKTFMTAREANAYALELDEWAERGELPPQTPDDVPVRAACLSFVARMKALPSKRTSRYRSPATIERLERELAPWTAEPWGSLRLSQLRRNAVDDRTLERAAAGHARSAAGELAALKQMLRQAGERGARFDKSILEIDPVPVEVSVRQVLDVPQLRLLASCAPAYGQRLLLFKGLAGLRITELLTLADDNVHLDAVDDDGQPAPAIFVPEDLCKERRGKWIELFAEEAMLLREQRMIRAPGTTLLFPSATGLPLKHKGFHRLIWKPAIGRAATAWRDQHGLADDAPTPFRGLRPHDLRATAATLMRDAGFTREQAAARLGHADTGKLLDAVYDRGDRRARQREAMRLVDARGLMARHDAAAAPYSSRGDVSVQEER